jgi:hypothetical protein
MQNTLAEVVLSLGPVDVDNGGILQPVAEETNHALVRVVLQRMEGFVDHYPGLRTYFTGGTFARRRGSNILPQLSLYG